MEYLKIHLAIASVSIFSLIGIYYIMPAIIGIDQPTKINEVINKLQLSALNDKLQISVLNDKLQISDISIVELGQLLIKRDDRISQQESVINRLKVALNENMFSQETIRAFENTEANLNLVSIPSQGTLQDLSNLMYFKTQFGEFYGQQVSRLCLNRTDPCLLNIPGINKHLDALETNLIRAGPLSRIPISFR